MQEFVLPKINENAPPQVRDATEGSPHRCYATVVGLRRSVMSHLLGPEHQKTVLSLKKKDFMFMHVV